MTKLQTKLSKVNEQYTINSYDNGFMFEVSGRDKDDDYVTIKLICPTLDEVFELVREAASMPRD